jgi:hypothetical protein
MLEVEALVCLDDLPAVPAPLPAPAGARVAPPPEPKTGAREARGTVVAVSPAVTLRDLTQHFFLVELGRCPRCGHGRAVQVDPESTLG